MDEGFTSYISTYAVDQILEENEPFPLDGSYKSYYRLVSSGKEQPQMTNANRYDYNEAYERTAYSKGAVFLGQLGYVIGQDKLSETLKAYFDAFKFTHPTPNDFRRVAERVSGIQLRWYLTDWTQTTNTIDYGIKAVSSEDEGTKITLERIGSMPMPLDVLVRFKNGEQKLFYVPIPLMRGEKNNPYDIPWTVQKDWPWAYPEYSISIPETSDEIEMIIIDPIGQMADINKNNNTYPTKE